MKRLITLLLAAAHLVLHGHTHDYLKPHHEQYQDIIINNVVVSTGSRECEARYQALKPLLDQYQRPFMVLDIGASQGYFSFRIAHDYPHAICVMIEGNYSPQWQIADQLHDLCRLNTDLDNIIFLKKKMTVDDIKKLAAVEHFDVVLCFNVLHHFEQDWQKAAQAVFELGDNIVIETPPAQEKNIVWAGLIDDYMRARHGAILCKVPRHTNPSLLGTMYLFEQPEHSRTIMIGGIAHTITSSYINQIITGPATQNTPWQTSLHTKTFAAYNGVFPTTTSLKLFRNH